jgi:hypothetical protein
MLNTTQWSQLIDPVVCRAQADLQSRVSGFVDRTALMVLDRLGCVLSGHNSQAWKRQQQQLQRGQWIDQQVKAFFEQWPEALGIEVDGGLSTRFHRISGALDWPRFHWRNVNTPAIVDYLGFIFPELDNYQNITSHTPLTDWPRQVPKRRQIPCLAIVGELNPLNDLDELAAVLDNLVKEFTGTDTQIHLLLTHRLEDIENAILTRHPKASIWDQWRIHRPMGRFIQWLNQQCGFKLKRLNGPSVHHVVLSFKAPHPKEAL